MPTACASRCSTRRSRARTRPCGGPPARAHPPSARHRSRRQLGGRARRARRRGRASADPRGDLGLLALRCRRRAAGPRRGPRAVRPLLGVRRRRARAPRPQLDQPAGDGHLRAHRSADPPVRGGGGDPRPLARARRGRHRRRGRGGHRGGRRHRPRAARRGPRARPARADGPRRAAARLRGPRLCPRAREQRRSCSAPATSRPPSACSGDCSSPDHPAPR